MEYSEAGTSTSNPLGEVYQVFLSFRGCDTRRGFTNSLYHALEDAGIRVFIDDEELRPGEEISGDLLRAIDDSKLYIPIFSKNYASSDWCLWELAMMVKNTSKSKEDGKKKIILPIFYDVTPDDVKLKTALYSKPISDLEQRMEDHKKKFSFKGLEMWRKALQEIDGTKGWELEKFSGHGDLIKTVVKEVVVRLKTRQRSVTKDLVGMEVQIAAINNLLDIDSGGVRLIGIYGMGGIGKTTLAKIIFNELCPCFGKNCSFLDDVRETTKTKGLVKLQKQLLSDISHSRVTPNIDNIDHGINIIGETIRNKKMLIVLDDVDKGSQIQNLIGVDSLYLGTRVLVTTRDKRVMDIRGFKYKFEDYEMSGLSNKDALKLFSRHAFDNDSPPANYHTLSEGIVSTTNGLPLALEAIGSSLFHQENKEIWKERLLMLRKTPAKEVLGKLKISYDALEPNHKQFFLDIACFFIGYNKTRPMDMWKQCGFSPKDTIDILIKRCMIKVFNHGGFVMHDQLRDLGRAIAKDECSRLWDRDDIICQMRSMEIKESVHAIHVPRYVLNAPSITITLEQIKRFPRLRYLSLSNVIIKGNFMDGLSNLKWINSTCSRSLETPNMLHLENLVQVELWDLEITKDGLESLIKGARKLKVLTLEDIRSICETPTFPEYSVLEKLSLIDCGFKEIDGSIGKLRCLTDLRIEYCSVLRKLPKQIGELQNLRHLILLFCLNLTELPDSVSKLVSLTELDVLAPIGRLPISIGSLPGLSNVNVSHTPIAEMPGTMSKFLLLQTLNPFNIPQIQELPKLSISLTILRLRSTALLTVPNLSNLTNLVDLLLSDGSEHKDIPNATNLADLLLSDGSEHKDISNATNLADLHLSDGSEYRDISNTADLADLLLSDGSEHRDRSNATNLADMLLSDGSEHMDRSNATNLADLHLSDGSEHMDRSNATNLADLLLSDGSEHRDISNATNLADLLLSDGSEHMDRSNATNLADLLLSDGCEHRDISNATNLADLLLSDGSEHRDISNATNLADLLLYDGSEHRDRSNATNLDDLLLYDGSEVGDRSNATQTCDLWWIGRLSKLRKLHFCFSKFRVPTTELGSLSLLKELTLYGVDLPTFKQLPSNLALSKFCGNQANEEILHQNSQSEKETEAKLYHRHEPLKVQLLDDMKLLERSRNRDYKTSEMLLCSVKETGSNELQPPQLTDRWSGTTIFPSSLKMLQRILLYRCPKVQDIQFVYTLESWREFTVKGCISLKRLGGLSNLKNLNKFNMERCKSLQVVEGINELECLQRLVIRACISMESVFHASSSKIPNECLVSIWCSGELLDTDPPCHCVSWESYREMILNGPRQASHSELETTESEIEIVEL